MIARTALSTSDRALSIRWLWLCAFASVSEYFGTRNRARTLLLVSKLAEVDDTIKIKTRVVFLDALVKDKRTNQPVSNLAADNFEVLDNGTPRPISYFTREGQARKPLALILILDLREDGAGRFLKNTEVIKAMENELAKLPPGDEVAIMVMDMEEDNKRVWLTEFTSDRAKLALHWLE
jgi:hypothetical protein